MGYRNKFPMNELFPSTKSPAQPINKISPGFCRIIISSRCLKDKYRQIFPVRSFGLQMVLWGKLMTWMSQLNKINSMSSNMTKGYCPIKNACHHGLLTFVWYLQLRLRHGHLYFLWDHILLNFFAVALTVFDIIRLFVYHSLLFIDTHF